ncbi:MAG: hypothetical protein BalsKO_13630 [Balneolaceae bacterium]
MNLETAKYIIDYFPNLMTEKERIALRHLNSEFKTDGNPKMEKMYRKKGWLTDDQQALNLIKNGSENFRLNVAERILKERSSDLYLNKCPNCEKLTRTPQSRQCRFCGHNWHDIKVADFKLNSSFELTGRHFFILGEITNGSVEIGNYIDLTMVGLNCKPRIESVEYVLKRVNGKAVEDIALGTNELTENQKEKIKKIGSFGTPFDIVKEK